MLTYFLSPKQSSPTLTKIPPNLLLPIAQVIIYKLLFTYSVLSQISGWSYLSYSELSVSSLISCGFWKGNAVANVLMTEVLLPLSQWFVHPHHHETLCSKTRLKLSLATSGNQASCLYRPLKTMCDFIKDYDLN